MIMMTMMMLEPKTARNGKLGRSKHIYQQSSQNIASSTWYNGRKIGSFHSNKPMHRIRYNGREK